MSRIVRPLGVALMLVPILACLPRVHATQPRYTMLDIGSAMQPEYLPYIFGSNGYINDLGDVVFEDSNRNLCLYRAESGVTRTLTQDWVMVPKWFNNHCEAGGNAGSYNNYPHPPGNEWTMSRSGALSWPSSNYGPTNDNGVTVTRLQNGQTALYDSVTGSYEYLNIDRAKMLASPVCINSAGDVAGTVAYQFAGPHAFVYRRNGVMEDLGTLGGGSSTGMAMNGRGQTVGASARADKLVHPFMSTPGQPMLDLGTLGVESGPNPSYATSINDASTVVGVSTAQDPSSTGLRISAFVYSPANGMQNLNDLVDRSDGTILQFATGVNNRGQIIAFGYGSTLAKGPRMKLLTPINSVPEPGSLALCLSGLVGLAVSRRRPSRR